MQVKIEMPVHVHEKHHILFTFYHISCEVSNKAGTKKREGAESLGKSLCVCVSIPLRKRFRACVCVTHSVCVCVYTSGLLLGSPSEGGQDAVHGAPAARVCHPARWLPV